MSGSTFDLNSLVISQESVATEAVAKALQGLVSLIKETGEVLPTSAFNKLDGNAKILAYLLGLRAAVTLGLSTRVSATAEEIAGVIGLDGQRAREYLSRLKGKYLQKAGDGWQLPVPRIPAACDEISNRRK